MVKSHLERGARCRGKALTPGGFIELALDNGVDLISICNATEHSSIEMVKYYDGRDKLKITQFSQYST